jgi:hypothetical protein
MAMSSDLLAWAKVQLIFNATCAFDKMLLEMALFIGEHSLC